ncbi:MAG: hypothetical protein J7521_08560 [Caulobacter sp.]|nr:hypothetical protein [Caulobacter sp.]
MVEASAHSSNAEESPTPEPKAPSESLDTFFGSSSKSSSTGTSEASARPARPLANKGFSAADPGLGEGESAQGVDLYAAASLPETGPRPATPTGDLWRRISPCWRPASPRQVTLTLEIQPNGGLGDIPKVIRLRNAAVDPQTLLAERAAVRAVQACAPYVGVQARRWRITFSPAAA